MEEFTGNSKGIFVNCIRRRKILTSFSSTCASVNHQSANRSHLQHHQPRGFSVCHGWSLSKLFCQCPEVFAKTHVVLFCWLVRGGHSDHGFEAPEWKSQCTGWHRSIGCYQACTSTSRYLKNHLIRLIEEVLLHRWKWTTILKAEQNHWDILPYQLVIFPDFWTINGGIFPPKNAIFWRFLPLHQL